jgi:tetratricopeptide (TPR) repeat protein
VKGARRRVRRLGLAWGVASCLVACAARAEAPSQASERAQALFEHGVRSFETGAFEAALADFRQSIDLYPTPAAWKNAALCLRELGRLDEALDLLEELPRRFPELSPEEIRQNAAKIDELVSQVGWVELRGVAPSSRLVVDGRDRGAVPPGARVRLSNGLHRVRVIKEGMEPAEASVSAVSGQTVVAELDQRP